MMKRFLDFLKETFRKKDEKTHNYHQFKSTYVNYLGRKSKVKLRNHIHKLATNLNELNYKGYNINREKLIEEFEYGGLEGVGEFTDKEISKFMKKSKEKR